MTSEPGGTAHFVRWHRERAAPEPLATSKQIHCLIRLGTPLDPGTLARLAEVSPDLAIEETLTAAYRRWGQDLPSRFIGACSFVLWDGAGERLFASVDPLGHHPLYFRVAGLEVAIASAVEALILPAIASVDPGSIAAHICGFAPKPGATFFLGVREIPPGGILTIDRSTIDLRVPGSPPRAVRPRDERLAAGTLRRTLLDSVPDYAPPDRPIGITLSSGLDSTTLAAALRARRPDARIVAFVWTALSVPEADESTPACRVARSLDLEIVEIAADIHEPLSNAIAPGLGSPLCNIYGEIWRETFRQAQKRGIETLFTGQGGDLGFGAVFPFADLFLTGRWLRLVREVQAYRRRIDVDLPWLIRYRILGRSARWFIPLRRALPPPWLGPRLREAVPEFPTTDRFALPGDRERRRFLDSPKRFAATAMMTAEAAEFGITLRSPWLDPRITDFARSLPAYWTFADGVAKALVRSAMRGLLPDEILDRSDKIYPEALFIRALRGAGRVRIEPLLNNMLAADLGFVEPKALRKAIDAYAEGKLRGALFWHSVTLEAWLRRLSR